MEIVYKKTGKVGVTQKVSIWCYDINMQITFCLLLGEAVCRASGDPHYTTFDSYRFDYQQLCEYYLVLMEDVDKDNNYWFSVSAQNEHRNGKTHVAYLKFIRVWLNNGNTEIILKNNEDAEITENVWRDVVYFYNMFNSFYNLRVSHFTQEIWMVKIIP